MGMMKNNSTVKEMNNSNSHNQEEEITTSILESSLISNSDLLGDTTNSDIYSKWLEEQRIAKLELDEFEMIERDVDNMAVTPLLMSVDGKIGIPTNHIPKNETKPLNQTNMSLQNNIPNQQSKWTHQSADY